MKRSYLKRKTPLRARSTLGGNTNGLKQRPSKLSQKGYKPPAWFNAIKPGSHGNTPAQKRLWRIVSETYRQADWEEYPHCRTCDAYLPSWKDGQCGHYEAYSLCHAWFKYHRKNLALQCTTCNGNFHKTNTIGGRFVTYLKSKYGENIEQWIRQENLLYRGTKMEVWQLVEYAAKLRPDLVIPDTPSTSQQSVLH